MNKIFELRHTLHQNPELSNQEFETSKFILNFIEKLSPSEIIYFENTGLAFVFNGKYEGKTLVFRTELDALPIKEENDFDYTSSKIGISHTCGHDGHMAIMAVLAEKISKNRPVYGKVVLLFQPAEEIGEGAKKIVNSKEFNRLNPNFIFSLHNIPGIEKHKIIIKSNNFAAASKGVTIKLFGKTAHAGEPENGISPTKTIADLIFAFNNLNNNKKIFRDLTFSTVIHIKVGEVAFGTAPGYAEIMLTLRAFENIDMKLLTNKIEESVSTIASSTKLTYSISYSELFPATVNNEECVQLIKKSALENKFQIKETEKPFRWSEDFGYFCEKYNCGYFGLGAGLNHPPLHNPNYDFPDDIIETGAMIFYNIYEQVNLNK
jgi:amidohydrolase